MTGTAPILVLDGVNKSFGGLRVIRDVSFAVARGSRTALIGPNGAGKTTIFNLISGVYPVDTGTIHVDGHDITGVAPRRRIRYGVARSFQNIRLMPHLSTLENVMLGQHTNASRLRDLIFPLGLVRRNRWAEAARAALEDAGLGAFAREVVSNLPYGVQKRIELVRALMSTPKLLLLDEPAAGLNSAETAELEAMLETISARGVTLFVVEHDMHFVGNLCEHVIVLNFGEKIFEGTPAGLHRDRAVLEAYLGSDGAAESTHVA